MKILLLGGFFGSGKTTILSRLTETWLEAGNRLCIIENEIGENSIDDLLLKKGGIEISTIMGGCVCCQVTGSLIEALNRIEKEINPDWVLVELTGIALLDTLRDTIEAYSSSDNPIITVSVIDAVRWSKLLRAAEPIVTAQVAGGDIIVVNKVDQNPDLESISADVDRIIPSPIILPMQATADSGKALVALLEKEAAAYA